MEEDNKGSDEFQFSIDVSERFYENFSSFFPLQLARITNNRNLPASLKVTLLADLEKRITAPRPQPLQKSIPEKPSLSSYFSKKFGVQQFWTDLNNEKFEVDEGKTKLMMVCDLSERSPQFIFLLNQEWVEMKKREAEEKEKRRLKALYEEQLKELKDPNFHEILKKIRDYSWEEKKFKVGLEDIAFAENNYRLFKRNFKTIFMKD